jgi:hypothetical protein
MPSKTLAKLDSANPGSCARATAGDNQTTKRETARKILFIFKNALIIEKILTSNLLEYKYHFIPELNRDPISEKNRREDGNLYCILIATNNLER